MIAGSVLMAASLLCLPASSAHADQDLSPVQAATLTRPQLVLSPPADGRLASYGVEIQVEGLSFVDRVDDPTGTVTAAAGAELAVIHVVTSYATDFTKFNLYSTPVQLAVQSGGQSAPLQVGQLSYPNPDDQYFVVAVSKGAPAILSLSVGGQLPQTFDLRTGARPAGAPSILYRAQTSPQVEVSSTALSNFTATTPAGTLSGQFGVAHATLAYWQPYTTVFASNPKQAYVTVEFASPNLSAPGYNSGSVGTASTLDPSQVSFVLPTGQVIPSQVQSGVDITNSFTGAFYALVPADVTSVKVILSGSLKLSGQNATTFQTENFTAALTSPVATTVTFPPAWTPAPAQTTSPTTAGVTPAASTPAGHRSSGSNAPTLIAIVVGLLFVGLVAIVAVRRVRSSSAGLAVTPVRWPPPELSAAASRQISTPRLELGPASDTTEPATGQATAESATASVGAFEAQPELVVKVMGPLVVEGLVNPNRRQPVRRMLVVLALNAGRPMNVEELAIAISDHPDRDPKVGSIYSYVSMLRKSLPPGLLPDAGPTGYQLDSDRFVCDWTILAAADATAESRHAALELIRGRPLQGTSWEGIEPMVRYMAAAQENLAHDLAGHHLRSGDPQAAEWCAVRGLLAAPGSVTLWQDRLDAAVAGSGYGLERLWNDCRQSLGADSALLVAHYQQLQQQLTQQTSPTPPASGNTAGD